MASFTNRGVEIPYVSLAKTPTALRAIERQLTVREKLPAKGPRRAARTERAFMVSGGKFCAPTVMALAFKEVKLIDTGPVFDVRPNMPARETRRTLYPYQLKYLEHLFDTKLAMQNWGRAYIDVAPGKGKTMMALVALARLRRAPALAVLPTKAIRDQWKKEKEATVPDMKYTELQSRTDVDAFAAVQNPELVAITVSLLRTLLTKDPVAFQAFISRFQVVVFDEAHELHSPVNLQVLLHCQVPYMIGLSGTTLERKDGMDRLVPMVLGPPVKLTEVVPAGELDDTKFTGDVREIRFDGDPEFASNVINEGTGTVSAICTTAKVIQDPAYTRLVVRETRDLLRGGHSVIVFAEHRDYLLVMYEAFMASLAQGPGANILLPGDSIFAPELTVLRGGATQDESEASKTARVVFTTYGYSRRGISLNQMTAEVLATSRRNGMAQILGRIMRNSDDVARRQMRRAVVDIRSMGTALASQFYDRRKAYDALGWGVERVDVKHTDV